MSQSNQRIDTEAARWAVRLHDRALTADEQAELDTWLARDVRHAGALIRARAAWVDLDRLAALGAARRPLSITGSIRRNWFADHRRLAFAAGVAAALVATGAWWAHVRSNVYVNEVGEVRLVVLSDGSHMTLNTATEAVVHYGKQSREIELHSGEGLFRVAKDPARPFIVRTGSVSVRAVGTVFAVRTTDQHVEVTVNEGVVEVLDNSTRTPVLRRVVANEHATVVQTRRIEVQKMPQGEVERQLAWRDGMLDFSGEPLASAVNEINRHNQRHIVVDDPTLADRPVVGRFRADDPRGFAATVAVALDAQSVEQADAIHLRLHSSQQQ